MGLLDRISKSAVTMLICGKDYEKDGILLERYARDFRPDSSFLECEFSTLLWTLLSEISTPRNLGERSYTLWPLLIFPYALAHEKTITAYYENEGFVTAERAEIEFTPLLHACLYGGQDWFDALRYGLDRIEGSWGHAAVLLWIKRASDSAALAAIARKLQVQLRPTLPQYEFKSKEFLYPAVIRAFHTPVLTNIDIHASILAKAANKDGFLC